MTDIHEIEEQLEHADMTEQPSSWKYEVPMALGIAVWALIILVINVFTCDLSNCSEKEQGEKTEMHSGGGGHH